jgi:CHAT domain-containing protein
MVYLALSYEGEESSSSLTFKLGGGQSALIEVDDLGPNQTLVATIDGTNKPLATDVSLPFQQSFYHLINSSKENTQRVELSILGDSTRYANSDKQIEYNIIDQDESQHYQDVFSSFEKFDPYTLDVNHVSPLFKLLQAPFISNPFSEYMQHHLATRSIEAKNWHLSVHLLRKIKTYTQQHLLLQCFFVGQYLNTDTDEFTPQELEVLSEMAVLLYYVALSQSEVESGNTKSKTTESIQRLCSPIVNSKRITNALQKKFLKNSIGSNHIRNNDMEKPSKLNSKKYDNTNYKADAGLLFGLVVENLPDLDSPSTGYILSNLWFLYNFYGLHGDAINAAKMAINRFEKPTGDKNELIELYNNIVNSLRRESRFSEARYYTQKGIELKAFIRKEQLSDMSFNKGLIYSELGEFESAIRYFEHSIEQLETDSERLRWNTSSCTYNGRFKYYIASTLVKIAAIKSELREVSEAAKYFVCAGELLNDNGGYYGIVLHAELARFAYLNKDYDQALWHVDQLLQRTNVSIGKPDIALPTVEKGAPRPINKIEALTIQLAINIARAPNSLSSIVSCESKFGEADIRCELAHLIGYETFYDQVLLAKNDNYLIQQIRIYTQLIKLHGQLQQTKWVDLFSQKSFELMKSASSNVTNLQAWNAARFEFVETYMGILIQPSMSNNSVNISKLHQVLESYYSLNPNSEKNLFSLPRQNNERENEIIHETLIRSVREAVSDTSQNALQLSKVDTLKDKYNALESKTQNSPSTLPVLELSNLQSKMADDEMLVRFFSTVNRTHGLFISKTYAALYTHQDTSRITKMVSRAFNHLSFNRKDRQQLRELFLALFPEQVMNQHNFKRLIIIPDGNLHRLPFSMLNMTKQQNRYTPLSSQYEVVRTTSASNYYRHQQAEDLSVTDIAVFANPSFKFSPNQKNLLRNSSQRQFSALPGTLKEANAIQKIFASSRHIIRTGKDATSAFLQSPQVRNSKLLHIATHGYYNSATPDIVGLITSSEDSSGLPGVLSFFDLLTEPVNSSLVVMSGCETMLGKNYKGSGMRSMTRGFLAQGAGSVISTLWPVQDNATAEFMELFYQHLSDTKNSSKALQEAKIAMSKNIRYKHPKHWAGFVLTVRNHRYESLNLSQ